MGQKKRSALGNKEEEGSILIVLVRPLLDETLRFRVQFWLVLLELGLD
jgi:hypothetical protein